ncbi:(+)-neomenthol dehydrogenase-like isoform X2 [Glycine soja]|uniref:(+)-neomenthol dehydrogenase-like isoform X2 n=1 Tax=Glycine soja TaxID=3848 RepID=UPI0010406BC6|nr:(+)-neomenthol dehydrogenase-like isoform X2 [Glycine soja]
MGETTERYAVVTGANKGIGLEIVRQLASAGIKVVLTARNEERGIQALQTLKDSGLSHLVLFHQVDVADATSVASLADFIKSKFGKLDILVNNAGILGAVIKDTDSFTSFLLKRGAAPEDGTKAITQSYELAEECLQINYYGAKTTVESLLPLLQLSDSPRIVNVSSTMGQLEVSSSNLPMHLSPSPLQSPKPGFFFKSCNARVTWNASLCPRPHQSAESDCFSQSCNHPSSISTIRRRLQIFYLIGCPMPKPI